jgi:pilus assembly protein Flp/PilA
MLHLYVSLQNAMARLRDEEDGATAVEYGLIVTLIAVVIMGMLTIIGTDLKSAFKSVANTISPNSAP